MNNEINPMQREQFDYHFLRSPRCGAKTRQATACRSPAVKNKKRCRMHGGTKGSGAPLGSQNALKHGCHTNEVKQIKRAVRLVLKELKN